MPKNKSKRQGTKATTGGADDNDDFDHMLAEVAAADPELAADVRASTATTMTATSSSSSSSSSGWQGASLPGVHVSEVAIYGACKRGDIAQLRRWGRQGVRVKSADVLIGCIFKETNFDILRCLVKELGADVNGAQLRDGGTPLYAAAQIGNLSYVQFLVKELGADVNQAANRGGTPLHALAQIGNVALVEVLVKELGADANKARDDGATPLLIAAQKGHLAVVRLLVAELRADVNQAAHDGATPLYIAAQNGHLAVVRCLVKEFGADFNTTRPDGATPLMTAATCKHGDVVTFLIKYGANVQVAAPDFGTAADLSKRAGAPAKQTQYLEARTHCAKQGCNGVGAKKCAGCLQVYYCTRECQLTHWPAHKAVCKHSAGKAASKKS
jgi:ankyrin repeat protein